jgi:hypothetical protein
LGGGGEVLSNRFRQRVRAEAETIIVWVCDAG